MTIRMVCAGVVLACVGGAGAIERELDLETIGTAITLGRTAFGAERARLHATYRIAGAQAPIDYVEIVTPFRRVVLAAQARAEGGERSLAQREALDLLASASGRMDVYVEMTFHPLNTFIGVPPYDVVLVSATGTQVEPASVSRLPRTGARLDSRPPALPSLLDSRVSVDGAPLAGATLVAQFGLETLDSRGRYAVLVKEGQTDVGRIAVELAALR